MRKGLDDIIQEETQLYRVPESRVPQRSRPEVPSQRFVGRFVSFEGDFFIITWRVPSSTGDSLVLLSLTKSDIKILPSGTSLNFSFQYREIDINTFPNFILYDNLSRCKPVYSALIPDELISLTSDQVVELCSLHFEMNFLCESYDSRIEKIDVVDDRVELTCSLRPVEKEVYLQLYSNRVTDEMVRLHQITQLPLLLLEFDELMTINIDQTLRFRFVMERILCGSGSGPA